MKRTVYLDNNATAPARPEAREVARAALEAVGNPSSVHGHGQMARRLIEEARERVARLVGASPAWVTFTSGGTEANALAFQAAARRSVFVSAMEHPSVMAQASGATLLPVTPDGVVDLAAFEKALAGTEGPAFVSVMLANNETGVVQPLAAVAEVAHRHCAIVHCDAVQAAGKMTVDLAALGVDAITLSAHKLGGLPGCGALIADPSLSMPPLLAGGGQERSRRAGTENIVGIAAFGAAADVGFRPQEAQSRQRMRDRIEDALLAIEPAARVFGRDAPRLPNTTCVAMPGLAAETQVIAMDLLGISVSAGAACSSGKVHRSHVLKAMGVDDAEADTAIRVSLGWANTEEDAERFIDAWRTVCMRTRGHTLTGVTAA